MRWDEMDWRELEQRRQRIAKRRWNFTHNEAKWDVLLNALRYFDSEAITEAMLASLDASDLAEITRQLQEYLTWERGSDRPRSSDEGAG